MLGFIAGDEGGALGDVDAVRARAGDAIYAGEGARERAIGTALCCWKIEGGTVFCVSSAGSD
ncbi:hypothetical protein PWEIH_16783 [Listeria weihenstephanensis FSL R9-0317]|nr:hypothetical protein PWEIH_16783 [Listeria weihenstephanensis FSL R9-0317]